MKRLVHMIRGLRPTSGKRRPPRMALDSRRSLTFEPLESRQLLAALPAGTLIFQPDADGTIYSVDPETGTSTALFVSPKIEVGGYLQNQYSFGEDTGVTVNNNGVIYFTAYRQELSGEGGEFLFRFDPQAGGHPVSLMNGDGSVAIGPNGDVILQSLDEDRIYSVDPETGAATIVFDSPYDFDDGADVAVGRDGVIYFTDPWDTGRLFRYDPQVGAQPIGSASGAAGVAMAPDGNVIVQSVYDSTIYSVNPETGTSTALFVSPMVDLGGYSIPQYQFDYDEFEDDVTVDGSGAIYFTARYYSDTGERLGHSLFRYDPQAGGNPAPLLAMGPGRLAVVPQEPGLVTFSHQVNTDGTEQADQLALEFRDVAMPFDVTIEAVMESGALQQVAKFEVSPQAVADLEILVELLDHPDAPGEHTLLIDPDMSLRNALENPEVEYLQARIESRPDLEPVPFRGFFQAAAGSRAVIRPGPGGNDKVAVESGLELSFTSTFSGGETSRAKVTLTSASDVLVVTGDKDDEITSDLGNNIIIGGSGDDTYVFGAPGCESVTIIDSAGDRDTLDFRDFPAGITVDLEITKPQSIGDTSLTLQASDSVEVVYGTPFNDAIIGNSLDNEIRGYKGSDTLVGRDGKDNLSGGDQADAILGDGFDLDAFGWAELLVDLSDFLVSSTLAISVELTPSAGGDDKLDGGAGDDFLIGGGGKDEIDGSGGNAVIFGDAFRMSAGLALDMTLLLTDFALPLPIGFFNPDESPFRSAIDLFGQLSLDHIGDDIIRGGDGLDVIVAGSGNDNITGGSSFADIVFGNDGVDAIDLSASTIAVAFGGDQNDTLTGGSFWSLLSGENHDDTLNGGPGEDVLLGDGYTLDATSWSDFVNNLLNRKIEVRAKATPSGSGNDTINGNGRFDILIGGSGNDVLDIGDGGVWLGGIAFGDELEISVGPSLDFESLVEAEDDGGTGTQKKENVSKGILSFALKLLGLPEFELTGSGQDKITGSPGMDLVYGGDENDTISTGGGFVDVAFGGKGNDTIDGTQTFLGILIGGEDDDTLRGPEVSGSLGSLLIGDAVSWEGLPTPDTLLPEFEIDFEDGQYSKVTWKAGLLSEGKGTDTLSSNSFYNVMIGGDGDDTLNAGNGLNLLLGDALNVGADFTFDFVDVHRSKTLEERLALLDDNFRLPGLAGSGIDTLQGGSLLNIVIAGGGNDTVIGGDAGIDVLFGNDGDDEIVALDGFNVIVGGEHSDTLTGGNDGNLILGDTFDFRLPGVVDIEAMKAGRFVSGLGIAAAGNGNDIIAGGESFDLLIGGDGNDEISGGGGVNLVMGDSLNIGATNFDILNVFTSAAKSLWFGDPDTVITDLSSRFALAGNGVDVYIGGPSIDVALGGAGDDVLNGGDGDYDILIGGEGNDNLDGQGDDDIVFGGLGDDVIAGSGGNDYLASTLGNDLFYGGPGNDVIRAGEGDDHLFGEDGDDELHGEEGDDTLDGGEGNDIIYVGPGTDTVVPGPGNDTIVSANDPPVANDDTVIADRAAPVVIDVLANDTDVDGTLDPASVAIVAAPANGITTIDTTTGSITYTPNPGFVGTDTFKYTVRDDKGAASNEGTVVVTVLATPANIGPLEGPVQVVRCQPVIYRVETLGTTVAGAYVDWGSDSPIEAAQVGNGTVTAMHHFAELGTFTVTVEIVTTTGSSITRELIVDVLPAVVAADPQSPGRQALFVGGTSEEDRVYVKQYRNGDIRVSMNRPDYQHIFRRGLDGPSDDGHIYVFTCDGNDWTKLYSQVSHDAEIYLGPGNDDGFGGGGDDKIDGHAGNDELDGGNGNDYLAGGAGNDDLEGGNGNDLLVGAAPLALVDFFYRNLTGDASSGPDGDDQLEGGSGDDRLFGLDGNDELEGGSGDDMLVGGEEDDELEGDSGHDVLVGGIGSDELEGNSGRDVLIGGEGFDEIDGDSDDDILIGGTTQFDEDLTALRAISAEWLRLDLAARARMLNLQSGVGPGGNVRLASGVTVYNDFVEDELEGDKGDDWFFSFALDDLDDLGSDDILS